ncbi:ribonuclease P protein component [Mariprofundus erugo]
MLSKADFSAMRKGRRLNHGGLRLVYRKNGLGYSRLGLAVSRKYGNAVERNLLKRQVREVFRQSDCHTLAIDLLLIPISKAEQLQNAVQEFSSALSMIGSQGAGKKGHA